MDAKAKAARNKQRFLEAWPPIVEELTGFLKQHNMPENAIEWYTKVSGSILALNAMLTQHLDLQNLEWNAPGGES